MPIARLSSAEIAKRGQDFYERNIRPTLSANDRGKFLVLDVHSGAYELDADEIAAVKRARANHPEAAFYILRVGRPAVYRLGRRQVASVPSAC